MADPAVKNLPPGFTITEGEEPAESPGNLPPGFSIVGMEPTPKKRRRKVKPSTKLGRVGEGMADPIHGGAKFLTHLLPESVVEAGNDLNNWLRSKGIPLAEIKEGGVDQLVAEREAKYAERREAEGSEGFDWMRMAGNIASPANAAIASRVPVAGALAARMTGGTAAGITMASLSPTGDVKENAVAGAIGGVAAPLIAGTAARVINPKTTAQVRKLLKEGVKLTPGQILGPWAKRFEEAMTSLPFIGDPIKRAQVRGIESFNVAAFNRALKPIGKKLPDDVPAGRAAAEWVHDAITQSYDDVLSKLHGTLDDGFRADIRGIRQMGKSLPAKQQRQLTQIIREEVFKKFTKPGLASGETVKNIESKLGGTAASLMRSADPDDRVLAGGIKELQDSMRKMLTRTNPDQAKALKGVNRAFANMLRAGGASGKTGAKEGIFTPAQLGQAVRQFDPTKRKTQYQKGKALMQDLSDPAQAVMNQRVADSGTPYRLLATNPITALPSLVGSGIPTIGYSEPGVKLSQFALTRRPPAAGPIANTLRRAAPFATPAIIPGSGVLKNDAP